MTEPNGIEARLSAEWRDFLEAASPAASPLSLPPERRQPMSRVALFAQLEEVLSEWRALRGAVQETIGGRFANASWTMKDLLAHLASWAREFRFEVETVHEKKGFDYVIAYGFSAMGPTQWNEREVQARKKRSLTEIFDEFERETLRLQELLEELDDAELFGPAELPIAPSGNPNERWQGPLGFIFMGKCIHDRHHFAQIRKRLKQFSE